MYDVIIIGGGPAGMSAALYLLRNNKKVLIIEKESFGGQISTSPRLENFPTIKAISGSEFSNMFFEQITELGADFDVDEVASVYKEDGVFKVLTKYSKYEARAVIAANGVKHKTMGLPNEASLVGKGVSYCAVCDGPFYKDKEIYLIGDANTALQYALLLADYANKIHIITLFDKFFGEQILIDRVRSNEKIDITHNMLLLELKEENGNLVGLRFENTQTKEQFEYKTDNVFIAIGQVPSNHLFDGIIQLENGFIVTNEKMETSLPGLFAAGDTRQKPVKQVITACNDGSIAALSALNYLKTL